jgi:hypothetical protein
LKFIFIKEEIYTIDNKNYAELYNNQVKNEENYWGIEV